MTRGGLTLLELLVVISMVGILLLVVATGVPRTEANSYAASLASRARLQAALSGVPVRVQDSTLGMLLFLPDGRAVGPRLDAVHGTILPPR